MTEQSKAQRLADTLERMSLSTKWDKEAAAELRRLDQHEHSFLVWLEKTEWVQETAKPKELGMHRADVLKKRIDDLTALNAELVEALTLIQPIQCDHLHHEKKHRHSYAESCPVKEWIDGVIAKAKEQT